MCGVRTEGRFEIRIGVPARVEGFYQEASSSFIERDNMEQSVVIDS